jgi:hypothetical protein
MAAALQNRWLLCLGVEATVLLTGDGVDAERRAYLLGAGDMLVQATGSLSGNVERVSGQSAAGLRSRLPGWPSTSACGCRPATRCTTPVRWSPERLHSEPPASYGGPVRVLSAAVNGAGRGWKRSNRRCAIPGRK